MKKSILENIKIFFGFSEEEETPITTPHNMQKKSTPVTTPKPFKGSLIQSSKTKPFSFAEIKVEKPKIYEDSLSIATHLREGKPVIVNLKYLDASGSKRLIDFICGTAYAINGHMLKVGESIFLFTPSNVLIANPENKSMLEQGLEEEEKQVFFKKVANI